MIENDSIKLSHKLSTRGLSFSLFVAIVTASCTALRMIWEIYHLFYKYNEAITAGAEANLSMALPGMQIRISLGLILSAIGLWFYSVKGLLISISALIWVGLEYLSWHMWSLRIKENAGIGNFQSITPYADSFYGATGWDISVLVIVIALFVWEVKIVVNLLLSSQKRF
jgi:hypothetical protein